MDCKTNWMKKWQVKNNNPRNKNPITHVKWITFIGALRIVKCKMWTWVQSVMMLLHATLMSHGDPLKPISAFMSTFSPRFHPYPVKQARTGRAKTCCLRRASALAHGHTLSDSVTCLTTDPWQGCSGNVGSFIVPVIKVSAVNWEWTSAMKSCLGWLLHSHWLALAQATENLSGTLRVAGA